MKRPRWHFLPTSVPPLPRQRPPLAVGSSLPTNKSGNPRFSGHACRVRQVQGRDEKPDRLIDGRENGHLTLLRSRKPDTENTSVSGPHIGRSDPGTFWRRLRLRFGLSAVRSRVLHPP